MKPVLSVRLEQDLFNKIKSLQEEGIAPEEVFAKGCESYLTMNAKKQQIELLKVQQRRLERDIQDSFSQVDVYLTSLSKAEVASLKGLLHTKKVALAKIIWERGKDLDKPILFYMNCKEVL